MHGLFRRPQLDREAVEKVPRKEIFQKCSTLFRMTLRHARLQDLVVHQACGCFRPPPGHPMSDISLELKRDPQPLLDVWGESTRR